MSLFFQLFPALTLLSLLTYKYKNFFLKNLIEGDKNRLFICSLYSFKEEHIYV